MANNVIKRTWNQNRMVQIEDLKGMTFQAEQAGHTFQISGVDDSGETVALTGTPAGVFLRPDNTDVALNCSVTGGVLSASLPAECYDVPGRFGLTVFITDSDNRKTAVYAAIGTVSRTSSGVVAPSTTTDVVDLINRINTAVATIPASYSALMADIAPTYSNSALYGVGQYVYYDGDLKRCISPITTAESYTAAHWTSAVLGNDVSDLKSALSSDTYNLAKINLKAPVTKANVTFTPDACGRIDANGLSDNTTIQAVTDDIYLTAGTYRVGCFPSIDGTGLKLQVREYIGGTAQSTNLAETTTRADFTLDSAKTVRVRIHITTGNNISHVPVNIVLTEISKWPLMFVPNVSAIDYVMRNDISYALESQALGSVSDLNNFTKIGYYFLDSSQVYSHLPLNAAAASILFVYPALHNAAEYIMQEFFVNSQNSAKYAIYRRFKSGGTWSDWKEVYSYENTVYINNSAMKGFDPTGTSDLNSLTDLGCYMLLTTVKYAHSPYPNEYKTAYIMNYGSANDINYRVQFYICLSQSSPEIYYRRRTGSSANPSWSDWVTVYTLAEMQELISESASKRTISDSFSAVSLSAQGNNAGTRLRVMTYNLANFDNDTANYISDEKLFNLKKAIMMANADFICGQEDRQYIDSGNTKASNNYVYYPIFPNRYGDSGAVIHSKIPAQEQRALEYTNGRILRYATFNLSGGIKLLLIDTHPVGNYNSTGAESAQSIAARKTQYEELFKWIKGTITLNQNGTSTAVSVPEFTHCIIGMDGNSITAEDKTNLLNEATGADFIAGNGGTIGWFLTNFVHNYSIDNIIVSNNIIINDIEAWSDWYERLYSDHVPVVADLTLLNA